MAIRRAVLLIADIGGGGYTRYLTSSAGLRRWIPTPSVAPRRQKNSVEVHGS